MRRGRSRQTTGPTAAALLAALLLSGCAGTAGFEGPDPLTGGPPIQRRTSPAPSLAAGLSPAPSASAAPVATGQVPPVPAPSTATSQAALAGGVSQPLDSGGNLRIGIGTPTAYNQEQPLWRSTNPAPQPGARPNDPPATGGMLPAPGVPSPATPLAVPAGIPTSPAGVLPGGGYQAATLDQALQQLNSGRRVTWQRLETLDKGGWSFQCAIANPANPNVEFNYKASGSTELEAVRRVLDQIALEKK